MITDALKKIYHGFDDSIGRVFRICCSRFSTIDKKKVVFMTHSDAFECNPKYVAKELIKQDPGLKLVWIVKKRGRINRNSYPKELKLVRRDSLAALMEITTAKVWVDNSINFLWKEGIRKKKKQVYIEIWHGSMGIKRLGREDIKDKRWVRLAEQCNDVVDYCVSNSDFETEVYRSSFWQKPEILPYGHPRNDCLFDPGFAEKAARKIRKKYGIPKNEKLVLYAPTFRENGFDPAAEMDPAAVCKSLSKRFGGKWRMLFRSHFQDRDRKSVLRNKDCVTDVTRHTDIQELLAAVDVGLTDYSSWAYDYILSHKPLFVFAPDIESYNNIRGLYYPLESTPFPIASDMGGLTENIRQFDEEKYEKETERFLDEKGSFEDGHASWRVAELIKEICKVKRK